MKEKFYLKKTSFVRAFLWLAVLLGAVEASAQTKENPERWEVGGNYEISPQFGTYYAVFTAPEDGFLTLSYNVADYLVVYTDAAFTSMLSPEPEKSVFPKVSRIKMTAGTTYYFGTNFIMSAGSVDVAFGEALTLELTDATPEQGSKVDVMPGSIDYYFNMYVHVVGETKISANGVSQILLPNVNEATTPVVGVDVKAVLMGWLTDGTLKEGDEFTITMKDVCSAADESVKYGEDGTLTATYVVGAKPLGLVKTVNTPDDGVDEFLSYYTEASGQAIQLVFDGNLKAESAQVTLLYGDMEAEDGGEYYVEVVEKATCIGNTLYIPVYGKRRAPQDMVTSGKDYEVITLRVSGLTDEKGNYVYSEGSGMLGSFSFVYNYKEIQPKQLVTEWTPKAGASLDGKSSIELYIIGGMDGLAYDGVQFEYISNGVPAPVVVRASDIKVEAGPLSPDDDILTIPVPAGAADPNSDIKVSFVNLQSADGYVEEHVGKLTVTYVTVAGMEAPEELEIASCSVTEGASYANWEAGSFITLSTNQDDKVGYVDYTLEDLTQEDGILATSYMVKQADGSFSAENVFGHTFLAGRQYEITFTCYASEADKNQGGEPMGELTVKFNGATEAFRFSDVTLVSVTPDPEVGFESAEENQVVFTFSAPVTLNDDLTFVNLGMGATTPYESKESSEGGKVWTLTIPQSTMTGEHVTVCVGAVDANGLVVEGNEGKESGSFFSYEIVLPYNFTEAEVLFPVAGATVESLSEIRFGGNDIGYSYDGTIEVLDMARNVVATATGAELEECPYAETDPNYWKWTPSYATVVLNQEITKNGTYYVVVPRGYFIFGELSETGRSKEMTITYVVENEENAVAQDFVPVSTTPAEGEVAELSSFTITCEDVVGVPDMEGALTKVKLSDANGKEYAIAKVEYDDNDWNSFIIGLAETITETGTYTLEIAAGVFGSEDYDPVMGEGHCNPALSYTFTVTGGNSIAAVAAGTSDGRVTVCTLDGVVVLKDADRAALETLKKGVYVVNGKKMVVK